MIMAKNLGQYSIVSYVHELRGERVNLGVLVWHPRSGCFFRRSEVLNRVRTIDESADLKRVLAELESISERAEGWDRKEVSPLEKLARQFTHGLVVTSPLNARIQDPLATLERLASIMLPPEPSFVRAPSTTQFANAFASSLHKQLLNAGVQDVRSNFFEEGPAEPIEVTALYNYDAENYVWRAFSFASEDDPRKQLRFAKAIHTDNADLRTVKGYEDAHLQVAVQPPKQRARAEWNKALRYLNRASDRVEDFEDRHSIEAKAPELLPPSLSPMLATH
jgi:hypothetical protein